MLPEDFYIIPEDLFRLGNSTSSKLSNIRSRDVNTINIDGVIIIVANGKGISVFDREGINKSPMTGWVWGFKPNYRLPIGLKLVKDKPHHYCIAPIQNMPVEKYKELLEKMMLMAKRVSKKEGKVA